jgi:hypothetical protein
VARAIFDALNTRHVSMVKLAAKLQSLARARHLAAWSSIPGEQTLWQDLGADGTRSPNDVLVAAEDLGASKLDFYVTEHVDMTVQSVRQGRRIELSISLTNPRRDKTSAYIDGGSIYADPGEYGTYLVVNLPRDSFDIVHDDPSYTSSAQDGPLSVTTFTTRVPTGTTKTIKLSFTLPGQVTTINVIPSARITTVTWKWNRLQFDDAIPKPLDLRKVPVGSEAPRPGWLLSGLLLFAIGAALAGDAWGRPGARQAKVDAHLGWWLLVVGVAMMTVQMAIFVTAA